MCACTLLVPHSRKFCLHGETVGYCLLGVRIVVTTKQLSVEPDALRNDLGESDPVSRQM